MLLRRLISCLLVLLLVAPAASWASFSVHAKEENGGGAADTTVDVLMTGTISIGDVIFCAAGNTSGQDITQITDGTTPLTPADAVLISGGTTALRGFYTMSSPVSGTNSVHYTATFGASSFARDIHCWALTPSAPATFAEHRADAAQVSTTNINSGNITTSGADSAVVAFVYLETAGTFTAQQIGGVAADDHLEFAPGSSVASWYRATGATTQEGTATASNSSRHITIIMSAKITGVGPTCKGALLLLGVGGC